MADVVIAWFLGSGLSPGKWFTRLWAYPPSPSGLLFTSPERPKWSSRYFRQEYAWPLLEEQRLAGEPTLQIFTDVPGNRICDHVWGFNSWRRGGRPRVTKRRNPDDPLDPPFKGRRHARPMEIYEQGRWRTSGKNMEDMPAHYNQWDLADRVAITQLCM